MPKREDEYIIRDSEELERRETIQYFRKRQTRVALLKILILLAIILGTTIIVVIALYI
jgi:predicted nucleic acid-binding Zn ribbon protein